MKTPRKLQRTIVVLVTVVFIFLGSLSYMSSPTQANDVREGEVKFIGVVVSYLMNCPPIFDLAYYCIDVENILSDPNNVLGGYSGVIPVIFGGWGEFHPNAEDAELGDMVEVYASCVMIPAGDPSIICNLSESYHYIRRIPQQTITITVTSTLISTVTVYTTVTSNTVTSVTTFTTTRYTTGTKTVDVTRTYTSTQTVTTTVTRTTTTTITITGPAVRIKSLSTEKQSYRPGEYIGLIIVFENVGGAGYVNVCYQITAEYLGDRWITRCIDLGFMNSGEERTIRDDNTVYAQCLESTTLTDNPPIGCTNKISVRLSSVNNNPPIYPSQKSIIVNVIIDDVIILPLGESYIIKDLRKNEVRTYHVYLSSLGAPLLGPIILIQLTIKRLDGGIFDWDEKVDVILNHYETVFDRGGFCDPLPEPPNIQPLRIGTNKGWKKFEITIISRSSIIVLYPSITQTGFRRVQYIAENGFKLPWDNSFETISKVCCYPAD